MRLGLALDLGSTAPVAAQVTAAQPLLNAAETAELGSVWVGESYHRDPEPFHLPASLLVLAHLAARTSLGLGAGVLLARAYNPTRLGYETALVDQLSDGRLSIGVGLGPTELSERFGAESRSGGAHLEAVLHAVRSAWGRHDRAASAVPAPTTRPTLLVGGRTKASVRRAAMRADGYFAATNYSDRLLSRQAAAYRDQGGTGDVVANRLCLIHPDTATARALADKYLTPVLDYYTRRGLWWSTKDDPAPGPTALVGSPAEVADALGRYAEDGVTAVNLRVAPVGMPSDVACRTVELAAAHAPSSR